MRRKPIHPGKFLPEELRALDMDGRELASALHVPASRVDRILSGQRAMTAGTALRLNQWLGTSAEMWMNLQKLYELRLAEQQEGDQIRKLIKPREPAAA